MSAARDKGTRAETSVVGYLTRWWPYAERRALAGRRDHGDIAGTPGVCWQIKSYADLGRAIREGLFGAEKQAHEGEIAVAVARRRSKPASQWYAVVTLETLCQLWHEADRKADAG